MPQHAHDVVKRTGVSGLFTNHEIKCQRDERAFGVVADQRIRCIFILPVIFDPCIETRFRHALFEMTPSPHDLIECGGDLLQIGVCIDKSAAYDGQIVIVAGESLKQP